MRYLYVRMYQGVVCVSREYFNFYYYSASIIGAALVINVRGTSSGRASARLQRRLDHIFCRLKDSCGCSEYLGVVHRPETPRHFLLNLDQAQIAFSLIV